MRKATNIKLWQSHEEPEHGRMFVRVMVCCLTFFCTTMATAAVEDLDESIARKSRTITSWGYSLLQNDANNYTWQPETLNYTDVTTNNEVWKFTSSPASRNNTQDIAITHWSANGNRLLFHSNRATNAFPYANGTNTIWMLANTDGSRLKPAKGAAGHLTSVDKYPLWSPILPDVFYQGMSNDGQSTTVNTLYKVQVSDTAISRSSFLTISPSNTGFISLKKAISPDGRKIVISADSKFHPATVYPEASKGFNTPAGGYTSALNLDDYWGSMTGWSGYHDRYMTGAVNGVDGIWNILVPSTIQINGPFWRARLSGSGANGAPTHTQDRTSPYNWGGEVEPVNTVGDQVNAPSPWCADGTPWGGGAPCIDSPGHGSPDRWGRYIISADPNDGYGYGLSFLDMRTHSYYSTTSFRHTIHNINHPDWEAWSDWSVASGSPSFSDPTSGPTNPQSIVLQKYRDPASQRSIAYTHARYNAAGSPPYEANARPTQSPDGTKVLFNSTFLNASDNYPQLFWTVAYYPYPPEIKSAAKNGGNVRLTWDFNQGTGCLADGGLPSPRTGKDVAPNFSTPRTYATRGWPHETLDCPPSPREIKQFRIWSSVDNATWTPAGTTAYNNCNGSNECGMWAETAWTYDYAQANNTTRFYAVTSLEHSGLESHALSNVWKVTLDTNGNITQQIQQAGYPANPGGKTSFYTTPPPAIAAQFSHKQAPATANGQYVIKWNAPLDASMIRYYNIYAKDSSLPLTNDTPLADRQKSRIASIPATSDYNGSGAFSYIDWLGATDGSTKYIVTAVDYQGNETKYVNVPAAVKNVTKIPPPIKTSP